MMKYFVLWKYGYGGLRLINSRSYGEVNEPSKAISIINDEIVQKTIVGHEFGVTMMNSCCISKTFVKEVEWDYNKEITCMAFSVLELKVVAINHDLICIIALYDCRVTLLLYINILSWLLMTHI
jgi:hypothetical protein